MFLDISEFAGSGYILFRLKGDDRAGGATPRAIYTRGDKARIVPQESSMAAGAGQNPGDGTKHPTKRQVSGLATAYLVIYNVVLCAG